MMSDIMIGVGVGNSAYSISRMEASTRQGHNHYLTSISQTVEVISALSFANVAFDKAGLDPFSWSVHLPLLAAPAILSYALSTNIENNLLREITLFAHDNIGTLSKLVSTVSLISLIYFSNILIPTVALAVYCIHYLDHPDYLSEEYRQLLHKCSAPISYATGLFYGGTFLQILSAIELTSYVAINYFNFESEYLTPETYEDNRASPLTHQTLLAFLENEEYELEVNRGHVHYEALVDAPNIDILTLPSLADTIVWDDHLDILQRKLEQDPRWTERSRAPGEEIPYLKESLRIFVESIANHAILQGEPSNYEIMNHYLKVITSTLQTQNDLTRANALIKLAIEGGDYCGIGKFRVAQEVYSSLVDGISDLNLETKILHSLQEERLRLFHQIYFVIWNLNRPMQFLGWLMDYQDIHIFNQTAFGLSSTLGLPDHGAEDDNTIDPSPVLRGIQNFSLSPIKEMFWDGILEVNESVTGCYTTEVILDHFSISIGTALLPKQEFYQWWGEWIERQDISPEEKDELTRELTEDQTLYGVPFEVNEQIQIPFIKAMLLEMGILTYGEE